MDTKSPDRVVELWPDLPEQARRAIVEIAEGTAGRPLQMTPDEEALIEQAREDFLHGRTMSMVDFSSEMDAFVASLRKPAG